MSTQMSAGVTTTGTGFASKEEESPVTKSSLMKDKKKTYKKEKQKQIHTSGDMTGRTTSTPGKAVKPSESRGSAASLDAPPQLSGQITVGSGDTVTYSTSAALRDCPPTVADVNNKNSGSATVTHCDTPTALLSSDSQEIPLLDGGVAVTFSSTSDKERNTTAQQKPSGSGRGVQGADGAVTYGSTGVRGKPSSSSMGIPPCDGEAVTYSTTAGGRSVTYSRKDRRNAERLVKMLGDLPVSDLDSKQSAKLVWAKNIIKSEDSTSKRQRSFEGTGPEPKRPKANSNTLSNIRKDLSFSDVLKDKTILAVIDRSNVDGMISFDRWTTVLNKLQASYWTLMMENPGEPAIFEDAGWYQGRVKLVAFDGRRSCDLYKLAISRLEGLWPGAKLEVVAREDIPCRPRARTRLPAELSDKEIILKMLQYGNPSLPTHDWKVAKLEDPEGPYRSAIIVINRDSLAPLASTKWVIRFGWSTITLKVYRKDEESARLALTTSEDIPAVEEPAGVINLPEMEIDAPSTPSIGMPSSKPDTASDLDAHTVDSPSDMETEDYNNEDFLLRSSSESDSEEDLNSTVRGGLENCNRDGSATTD